VQRVIDRKTISQDSLKNKHLQTVPLSLAGTSNVKRANTTDSGSLGFTESPHRLDSYHPESLMNGSEHRREITYSPLSPYTYLDVVLGGGAINNLGLSYSRDDPEV
jgi:hypothetical protein